ncbi:hypothetical protein D0T25_28430 [Duganella sp. BJB488]|uniref:substrate-binding periplasmic protein n=1 Tax=unclassified Duganella TaxID=2636909 RepID=UPI000E34CC4C|nr:MULTISPECIES: transporter substrate-binding domain-containing protein [unclassified Duganella]RFP09874.1 hypothetical protein D0T26_28655 [Duganella sp. BJB489]RFP13468.1 hypothetical protein D0T25_28430 [Duganella sp. BJB488]RFP29443.1 hypothetical protein D0T24_29185 [Duganella sp. BJB480]
MSGRTVRASTLRRSLARSLAWTLALALAWAPAGAAPPAPLRLLAADLPPYAVAPGGDSPGALVELAQEMARRVGAPVTLAFYPWQRALALTGVQPRTLVVPLTRTPEREAQYRWLVRLRRQDFVFVGRRGGGVDLRDPAALARRPVAVLRGSPHKRLLESLHFGAVAECASVRECMRMVGKGVVDATYGGEDIHRHAARLDGFHEADFDFGPVFRSGDIWLAGSRDIGEDEGRAWRAALDAMRADGTQARLLRKYGLTPN